MSVKRTWRAILTALTVAAAIGVPGVEAQQIRAEGPTPPRLSFVDGEVSYWRPGAENWAPAQINTALAAGDSVYGGNGGNVEIEIGTRAYVRGGSGTEIGIESLETGYLQLRVPSGHAVVDLRRLREGQEIEVGTPNGAFLIDRAGYYRFDVDESTTRFSARRGGVARIVPAGGAEVTVDAGDSVVVSGTESATIERVAAVGDDAWDRWNQDRTAQLGEAPRSAAYVPPDVAGVDDLDRYGDWRETPKYGHVWVPRDVSSDWTPYSTGRWVWDGYYGWTWVDDSPWGWAPYHYGRWCWNDSYWGWAPGPVAVRPVYAPALVAFFGGPHLGVSVSIGTPFVSWVPLGWGEPVVPWWGPRGFVGRPYWGGWGGPRVVNNVVIKNTTIVNVNNINQYDNFRNRRAVIGVDGDRFGRGRVDHVRVDPDRVRNLRPVRGELGVRPVRESLVPRAGRGERPPDRIQNRRVVATRAPQDPARQPRAASFVRGDARRQAAPPTIVAPTSGRRGRGGEAGRSAPPIQGMQRGSTGDRDRGRSIETREERDTGRRGGQEPTSVERNPSRGRGEADLAPSRGAAPPSTEERGRGAVVPRERDRDGLGRERPNDSPAPPAVERGRQQDRGRGVENSPTRQPDRGGDRERSRGASQPPPPPTERDRGSSEVRVPRSEPVAPPNRGGDARERGDTRERKQGRNQPQPERDEAPQRTMPQSSIDRGNDRRGRERQQAEQPQRAPQVRQKEPTRREAAPPPKRAAPPPTRREAAPPPTREQREPRGDSGRSSRAPTVDRGSAQRERPQAEPRVQRGGDARPDGGGDARNESRGGDERPRRGRDQ